MTERELDAEVARRLGCALKGWECRCPDIAHQGYDAGGHLPLAPYSSDVATAWVLVEEGRKRGMGFGISVQVESEEFWAEFYGATASGEIEQESGATAPLAICRAFLAATEKP